MGMRAEDGRPLEPRERLQFAGVLVALAAISVAAQAGCRAPRATREDAAEATFKVTVDVYTDPPGIYEMLGLPTPPEGHEKWTGTAWVAEYERGTSYLVTAGHVCESRTEVEDVDPFFGVTVGKLKVHRVDYRLTAEDGTEVRDLTVLVDDDDADLCVMSHRGWLAAPLPIATEDPERYARGWYAGAPAGVWGEGVAMTYDLVYDGRGRPFSGKCGPDMKICEADGEVVSGSVTGGASGSAILFGGRVVGVLNLALGRFPDLGVAVPWNAVRRDLDRARHRY